MDDAALEAVVDQLVRNADSVRDADAVRNSVEIVRHKRSGDRVTVLARWTEPRKGRLRRGAVDLEMMDGTWRSVGGWSSNANYDSDNPVWDACGGSGQSVSGWLSNPAAATVRFRRGDGSRVDADTIENGATILLYETPADRGSLLEILDKDGAVLHVAPFA